MTHVEKIGDWSIATKSEPFDGWFTAWAKKGEIVTDSPLQEPGEVWFEIARTNEEAVRKLRKELGLYDA